MRKHMNVLAVLGVLALATVPVAASAATLGGEVFGAYNSYNMSDVNDGIDQANAGGANFDNITSGVTGGLGLRMWANPNWMFSASWEPLFAKTEDKASNDKGNVDANSFQFTGAYFWPSSSKAKYGLGAGLGYYSLNGSSELASVTTDITGSAVGFHFMGMGEWQMSPGFSFTGSAGYRIANVEEKDVTPTTTVDYSGFMGRVGLAFYMPTK